MDRDCQAPEAGARRRVGDMKVIGQLWEEQPVVDAARSYWNHAASPDELYTAFVESTLWAERTDPAGLRLLDTGSTGVWLQVWTSADRMAASLQRRALFLSAPGREILQLIKDTNVLGIVIDAGQPHWIALPAPREWAGAVSHQPRTEGVPDA